MKREIENLHWYSKTLLKEYWEQGMGLDALNEKYGISKKHLTKDLNTAILTIREKVLNYMKFYVNKVMKNTRN